MRVVRFILFVLACVFLIWLIVFLLAKAFSGSSTKTATVPDTSAPLSSYTDSTAIAYMDGPIVSDQEHVAIRISVNKQESRIERLTGYNGQVAEARSYPKTEASYVVFLKALEQANFMNGEKSGKDDESGKCAGSNRFVYRLQNGGSDVFRYWTTTCGGGTFKGSQEDTLWLFREQIPHLDYNEITSEVPISS